jgi:hypothetical protein
MDALDSQYTEIRARYDSMVALNDPSKVTELQALNQQMADILHQMLDEVAKVKGNAANLKPYQDELMQKLVRVQNDTSIILKQKDQYDTLKAIQSHEQIKFSSSFFWYAISLCIATVFFIGVLMWKGGYHTPAMPTMMSSPTTTPAFM